MGSGASAAEDRDDTSSSGRTRLPPARRHAAIVAAARQRFLTDPDGVTLGEVASTAGISRSLVYSYFPGGRSELRDAVIDEVAGELRRRLAEAASAPFSDARRLEHQLAALFGWAQQNPAAHRLIFHGLRGADDANPELELAVRADLAAELAGTLATSRRSADELLVVSRGVLGLALAAVDLALAGEVDAETAWRVACDQALRGLATPPDGAAATRRA